MVLVKSGPSDAGPGQVGVDLDHQEPVGVAAGQQQLVVGGADVEREVDRAVEGRGGQDGHHPRVVAPQDGGELAEAARDELDVGPSGQQHALGRAEEAAPVGHVGVGEHRVVAEEEGAADRQVDPVVPSAEGGQEGVGVRRAETEADRCRSFGSGPPPRRACRSVVPSPQCGTGPVPRCGYPVPATPGRPGRHVGRPTGRQWEHGPMRFDTQLAGLEDAADHARRLEALGVDGAFTFEGPHDVFTPADPGRRGVHHPGAGHQRGHRLPPQPGPAGPPGLGPPAAGEGAVHPRTGQSDPGPGGEAVRGRVRPAHRPDAGAGGCPAGHLRHLGDGRAPGLPGRVHLPHADAARCSTPGPTPTDCPRSPWAASGPRWSRWPPRWPTASWSCPSTPGPTCGPGPCPRWPRDWPGPGGPGPT